MTASARRVLQMRLVVEVADARAVTDDLVGAGAELLAPPTRTPWGSLNSRLDAPGGLQVTVFDEPAGDGTSRG